jgi:hypothetical protein
MLDEYRRREAAENSGRSELAAPTALGQGGY